MATPVETEDCLESIILAECMTLDSLMTCGLQFLKPSEVLAVANNVSRQVQVAMTSSQTDLWRALVRNAFPRAPFSPCSPLLPDSESSSSSGESATWEDVFRLLAASRAGSDYRADLDDFRRQALVFHGPEIIPLRFDPDQQHLQATLVVLNRTLSLSLSSKSYDGVLLRERVQVAKLLPRQEEPVETANRFKAVRYRLATMSFTREKGTPTLPDSLEGHAGTFVLTNTQVLLQSSDFDDIVRISDLQVIPGPGSKTITLLTDEVRYVVTVASQESSSAWVAVIESIKSQQSIQERICKPDPAPLVEKPTTLASKAKTAQKFDPLGRLSRKWASSSSPRLPRIRSITCPGPSSNVPLFPISGYSRRVQVLESGAAASNSINTAFSKANRLLKSMSFADSATSNSSTRLNSTPSFFKPQFTSRGAFSRFFKPLNETILAKSRRRNRSLKRVSSLWSSFSSTISESSHAETDEGQQVEAASEENRRASRCNSHGSISQYEEHHHCNNNSASSGSSDTLAATVSKADESCRVRRVVFNLLESPDSFEGHVCKRFFERQQQRFHDSSCPVICRGYLTKVRDCIQDLVQFILSFRLAQLQSLEDEEPQHDDDESNKNSRHFKGIRDHTHLPNALASQVQIAVEAYFYTSSNSNSNCPVAVRLNKWCSVVASVPDSVAFECKLIQWSTLSASSDEFALSSPSHSERSACIKRAIHSLKAMSLEVTPSQKLARFMDAVQALNDHITSESPATYEDGGEAPVVCDADELLPLLIFALCKSRVAKPLAHCVAMQQLCPFDSQHGECVYYLTMFETALEFVRTYPTN